MAATSSAWAQATTRDQVGGPPAADGTPASPTTTTDPKDVVLPSDQARIDRLVRRRHRAPKADPGDVVVTGSRLKGGDVTTRVTVITAEQIRERGVSSVAELIRTLPQNVATIDAIANERAKGPLGSQTRGKAAVSPASGIGTLGLSAANLGGVGAGNTLVLVDGRRIAGAAGIEDGFVNLNGIPLSAVDRVEISTGGASAIYGADALGGVINFILKKGYVGTTLGGQYLNSSSGANDARINLYSGYAWHSGSVSLTAQYENRLPINNRKSGYVTNNYSSYFNNNPAYDFRSFTLGLQPGVIDQSGTIYDPTTGKSVNVVKGLTLPTGFTGKPRIADFVTVGSESLRDYIPELAGPKTETISATINLTQNITDKLQLFATGLYNRNKNTQQSLSAGGIKLSLAPGQYYNPFPNGYFGSFQPTTDVYYYPGAELADGTLPSGETSNVTESWNASVGARYQFNKSTKLEVFYTRSRSSLGGDTMVLGSVVSFSRNPSSPTGVSCTNFDLVNNRVSGAARATLQAIVDKQCQALTSSDPNLAFDPFKSTTNGGGSSIMNFYYRPYDEQRVSTFQNIEAHLDGTLVTLPMGPIVYAIGGEYAKTGVDSPEVESFTGQQTDTGRYAFYAESTIPLLGGRVTFPLMRELTANVAARRDIYDTVGAVGTVNNVPFDQGGVIVYGKNHFDHTTPAYGLRWRPFNNLSLRARWTTGFSPPPPSQLFALATGTYTTYISADPLYTCTTDCVFRGTYTAPARSAPNPNLRPETSRQQVFSATWQPGGALAGLNLAVTYSHNRIIDQYAAISTLYALLSPAKILQIAQFYPRDPATGKILQQNNMTFNIIGSEYSSITYEASYGFYTRFGRFEPRLTYLDNLKAETTAFADSAPISVIGTVQGVDRYKLVASLTWQKGPFNATFWAYHTPGYLNDYAARRSAGTLYDTDLIKPVASLTTYDLTFSWNVSNKLRVDFAGRNIFKAPPPFAVIQQRPYDAGRYNVAGRTLSLSAQYTF